MKYRKLGKTAIPVSVVGVGTWQPGGEWGKIFEQAEVDATLGKAGDLGVNLIDTAECYGDHLSEELVGRAIKGQRDRWVIPGCKTIEQVESNARAADLPSVSDDHPQAVSQ